MKKICSRCQHVNPYEADVCEKCGCDLNANEAYKQCPACGKMYDLHTDECPECRETLVVRGRAAARVFDETEKAGGVPVWAWLVGVLLPVAGFIFAAVYGAHLVKTGKLSDQERKGFCFVSLFGSLILYGAGYLLVSLVLNNMAMR